MLDAQETCANHGERSEKEGKSMHIMYDYLGEAQLKHKDERYLYRSVDHTSVDWSTKICA